MTLSSKLFACVALMGSAVVAQAQAAPAQFYKPYQAVYDLKLKEVRESGEVSGVSGRLVFRLDGDACSGYVTESRFVMQMLRDNGSEIVTDIRSSNWEAGDGSSMRFITSTRMNGQLVSSIEGSAQKEDGDLIVEHTQPKKQTFRFDDQAALFPMQFHRNLMKAISGNERFLNATLFDGGEEDGAPIEVTAVLGQRKKVDEAVAPGAPVAPAREFWPVSMAYFNTEAAQDSGPDYMVNFALAPDGIERAMTLDYGTFTVDAVLEDLQISEADRTCN